jgi:hypothetical protein
VYPIVGDIFSTLVVSPIHKPKRWKRSLIP